jgi:hypothetical protein
LNYCKEGIKYEEQKNLAMDVHYKEPIPDAKSHMFAHPFFFTDPCAPGLHKTYTSKVFFARWICEVLKACVTTKKIEDYKRKHGYFLYIDILL